MSERTSRSLFLRSAWLCWDFPPYMEGRYVVYYADVYFKYNWSPVEINKHWITDHTPQTLRITGISNHGILRKPETTKLRTIIALSHSTRTLNKIIQLWRASADKIIWASERSGIQSFNLVSRVLRRFQHSIRISAFKLDFGIQISISAPKLRFRHLNIQISISTLKFQFHHSNMDFSIST